MLNKAPTSNILLTGLLPRDKYNSNKRKRFKKVNSYLLSLCKNENNMLYMDQGRGWTLDDQALDESLYYVDQLHLIEAGNAKFALSISNTIRNFNDLKFKLQSRLSMLISHTKSVPVTSSETSLPLSMPPTSHKSPPSIYKPPPSTSPRKPPPSISFHKPPPSTSPHKPRPSTSPQKPPPSTSPLKPRPSTSPHKPRPSTSPQKPPPSTSPLKPRPSTSPHKPRPSTSPQKPPPSTSPLNPCPSASPHKPHPSTSPLKPRLSTSPQTPPPSTSPHKPLPSTSPQKPHPSASPQKPPPSTSPQKTPPLTSPQKPPPPTSPHKPPPSTPFQKPPPSISPHKPRPSTSPHKLRPSTSIHKQPPSISFPKLPSSLSSQQSINLKSYTKGASFITYFYFILFILLYASPIFLNIVINLKLNIFISNSIFLKFVYTIFRLEFFDIFLNRIFIFLLEYYDSYIVFTYRKYLTTLDKNGNSTLLKQVWIVLLTTLIFWVFFVIIDKFFSKSTRYFKPYKPCKTKNKNNHVFIILKRFLFACFWFCFHIK